jgi:hypothetical protein
MCYKAAIALSGDNEITLTKPFIISLEGAASNWYARLLPRSITSWYHLKEKFLVNFQEFYAELNIDEDILSCQQYKHETLSYFFRKFLHLKVQATEVSFEQVIIQAIKALRVGQLHSYLVRECPRMLEELYDNLHKFNKSGVLHFHKLEQQRKVPKENEASRPNKFNRGRKSTMSFDNTTKMIHSTDLDGSTPPLGK